MSRTLACMYMCMVLIFEETPFVLQIQQRFIGLQTFKPSVCHENRDDTPVILFRFNYFSLIYCETYTQGKCLKHKWNLLEIELWALLHHCFTRSSPQLCDEGRGAFSTITHIRRQRSFPRLRADDGSRTWTHIFCPQQPTAASLGDYRTLAKFGRDRKRCNFLGNYWHLKMTRKDQWLLWIFKHKITWEWWCKCSMNYSLK